ncbi:calmodulin-binding-domain-containing protein [Hyaloraphidium curvatum]|nr:calmodulin-binding-domain-containing protein [Hyaloraphidium curvatum]
MVPPPPNPAKRPSPPSPASSSAPSLSPPRKLYKSQYSDAVRREAKARKHERDMFGLPDYKGTVQAGEWLRKGVGARRFEGAEKHERDRTVRKPPLPKEPGLLRPPKEVDWVAGNMVEADAAKPPEKPQERFFVRKPEYGRAPSYLLRFRRESEAAALEAQEKARRDAEEALARQGLAPLPEDVRMGMLDGLRENLRKAEGEYGRLGMVADTVGKIRRKQGLEDRMRQLERDIAALSDRSITAENPVLVNVGPEEAMRVLRMGWHAARGARAWGAPLS